MLFNIILLASLLLAPEISLKNVEQLEATTQQVTRVYFVRHGESIYNVPDENGIKYITGKSLSIPLTELGKRQATNLGKELAGKFPKNEKLIILSSTAVRAQQTATLIFEELKAHYAIEQGDSYENLCELGQGIWESKQKNVEYEVSLEFWNALSAKDKFQAPRMITGESYMEGAARAKKALDAIVESYPDKTILVTCHYGTMNALAHLLRGTDDLSEEPGSPIPCLHFENCDVMLVEYSSGQYTVKMHFNHQ